MDENDDIQYDRLFLDGASISLYEANELEERLKNNPDDTESRIMLNGFYFSKSGIENRRKREPHILWFIENHQEIRTIPLILNPEIDKAAYPKAKTLWLKHTREKPENTRILGNAATFFTIYERELAIELLKRAQAIEPDNPDWPNQLGRVYMLGTSPIRNSMERIIDNALKAQAAYEEAYNLETHDFGQISILEGLAKSAFCAGNTDKAVFYANELLQKLEEHKDYFNYGEAFNAGHSILGRIALAEGNLQKAKDHLLNSAGILDPTTYIFDFNPNMVLAKELLELGEKQVVLEYLALCQSIWHNGQNKLDKWAEEIRNGCIPEFSPYLMR